jgi:competence protein ComEC
MGVFCPGEAAGILRAAPAALAARAAAALAGEHDRWILWLPVLIGSGIGFYFSLPVEPPPWLGPAALGAVLTGCIALRRAAGSLAYLGLLLAAATLAGFAAAQARTAAVAAPAVQERVGPTPIFGRIVKLERLGKGRRVTLDALEIDRLSPEELPARVRLRLNGKQPELAPGDRIRIYGVLSPPSPPTAPGAFDFQRQAFFARLGATGFGIGQAEVVSREPRQLDLWLSGLRARADGIIHASVPAPQASVTSALLTGERTAIPAPVMAAIRDSGLAHLLSISGLHIGLVAGFLYATMRLGLCLVPRLALGWPIQKWAAGVAVLGAGGYTLLSDATIPSQRAFLMVAVVFLGVICDRKAISMRLVAIAATAVLLAQPESLLGASFQMSFAAVVALIAAFDALYRKRVYRLGEGMLGRCLVYVALVALTTMVATAATAPYAIFHFQRFAVHSLPANLVAVPLTALWIMPFGVGALLAMPLGLAAPFLTAMGWGGDGGHRRRGGGGLVAGRRGAAAGDAACGAGRAYSWRPLAMPVARPLALRRDRRAGRRNGQHRAVCAAGHPHRRRGEGYRRSYARRQAGAVAEPGGAARAGELAAAGGPRPTGAMAASRRRGVGGRTDALRQPGLCVQGERQDGGVDAPRRGYARRLPAGRRAGQPGAAARRLPQAGGRGRPVRPVARGGACAVAG